MRTTIIATFCVTLVICAIGVFKGLNPKKWVNWMYGVCGFISGLLIGSLREDIKGGVIIGVVFMFAVMFSGTIIFWQRQYYGKKAGSWVTRHEKDQRYSSLAQLIRKILNK
jgi:hypothetical protein